MNMDATETKDLIPKSVTRGLKWENISPSRLGLLIQYIKINNLSML